jgi:HEPN domain-containing protein
MAMPTDIDARRFYRVAYQRYEDGKLLLEQLSRPRAAIYLAGYAVECILKALLLVRTPEREREQLRSSFRGTIAHSIIWLREQLVRRIGRLPVGEARNLSLVSSWSTDLRYEPGPGDPEDAEAFLEATRSILVWADGRI